MKRSISGFLTTKKPFRPKYMGRKGLTFRDTTQIGHSILMEKPSLNVLTRRKRAVLITVLQRLSSACSGVLIPFRPLPRSHLPRLS
jgi:hypothetical protein